MKPIATIKIDFLLGSNIDDAVEDAIRLARMLNLAYVEFVFNEYSFLVSQNANADEMIQRYKDNPKNKNIIG